MEAKVARWREVEAGTRFTATTAMERYPQLTKKSCKGLPSEIAKQPKGDAFGDHARDVKTYLAADVDALDARLAAPDPVDPRWREVEAGTRHTAKTAMERFTQLHLSSFKDLPFEIATKPKIGIRAACDVKTYLASDVEALVARLAAPEPVDPRWREVEAGTRFTAKTAMERYPHLDRDSFKGLSSEIARQPKQRNHANSRACDVKTYSPADVDALVARLAARDQEPVDPRWLEVEAGRRYDRKTAMKRYPQLKDFHLADLPLEIARRPKTPTSPYVCDVKTYLASDVDALAARLAAPDPEPVDPRWLEVVARRRYDRKTAMKRYPQLTVHSFADLPFEIARRPKIGKARYACDVKTYAAADVEKLAAARAKKRARVQEPEPPQEEPEPEEEPEECPVCLDPMTGATATLVCGHLFCKDCITDWARSQTTCPTCRATLEIA
jgi:hypothetical protein